MNRPIIGGYVIHGLAMLNVNAHHNVPPWYAEHQTCCVESDLDRMFYYSLNSETSPSVLLVAGPDDRRNTRMWTLGDEGNHVSWNVNRCCVTLLPFDAEVSAAETRSCAWCLEEGDGPWLPHSHDGAVCTDCAQRCGECHAVTHVDELTSVRSQRGRIEVCDECSACCYRCDEYYLTSEMLNLWDERYCINCTTSCEGCGSTMPLNDDTAYCSDDCGQDRCDCDSPQMVFTIRNDGDDPLPNDTRVTVALPAGMISPEGMSEIQRWLNNYSFNKHATGEMDAETKQKYRLLSAYLHGIGNQWQTKEGNFTKRLSRQAYKAHQLKLPPEVMSEVGNIARDHSVGTSYDIEVTRDLNMGPEEFANEDSCWWQSYYASRCALKSNGGFGIRAMGDDSYYPCEGRVWVIPLKREDGVGQLLPTFDTETPAAFIAFNSYGTLSGYVGPRVLAHMVGMTYRKIEFGCLNGDGDGRGMYINGGSAYLVAPEDIAEDYTDGSLMLTLDQHASLYKDERLSAAETNEEEEYAHAV